MHFCCSRLSAFSHFPQPKEASGNSRSNRSASGPSASFLPPADAHARTTGGQEKQMVSFFRTRLAPFAPRSEKKQGIGRTDTLLGFRGGEKNMHHRQGNAW